jgi:hypothetical protein
MTDNPHWLFLEALRRSGVVNMFGAAPYLEGAFGMDSKEAIRVLAEWMRNYNRKDYE